METGFSDVFHSVYKLIPDDQNVEVVEPETSVAQALDRMAAGGFSQLPVVLNGRVLGLFSYRSLVKHLVRAKRSVDFSDLTVDECMDFNPRLARVSDEISSVFNELNQSDAVLIGEPERLRAIVTPMDVLRYLYQVASPFVLLVEIELAVRSLIRASVDPEALAEYARKALARRYEQDHLPTQVEDMTVADYVEVVCFGDFFPSFQRAFGGSRDRVRAKLNDIRDLRNVIFHMKRDVTIDEHQRIVEYRDWAYSRVRMAAAAREVQR